MIERNRNRAGRVWCMIQGAANLVDGVVRVASLGFFHTRLPLIAALAAVRRGIQRQPT